MRTELRPITLDFPSGQGIAWRQEWNSRCLQYSKAGSQICTHDAPSEAIFSTCFYVLNHYELNKLQEELQDLELKSMLTWNRKVIAAVRYLHKEKPWLSFERHFKCVKPLLSAFFQPGAAQHIKHVPRCQSDLVCRLCLALSSWACATESL